MKLIDRLLPMTARDAGGQMRRNILHAVSAALFALTTLIPAEPWLFDVYARLLRQSGHDVGRGYEASRRAHEAAVVASRLDVGQLKNFHGLIITAGQRARAAGGWAVYGPTIGVGSMNR